MPEQSTESECWDPHHSDLCEGGVTIAERRSSLRLSQPEIRGNVTFVERVGLRRRNFRMPPKTRAGQALDDDLFLCRKHRHHHRSGRQMVSMLVFGACALISGCQDHGTSIWQKKSQSPDGQWLAIADTKQWSGPGGGYVATSVYLKLADGSEPPVQVLGFSNDTAYPTGITSVTMKWLNPNHLTVAYGNHSKLDFQAIKCSGVDISISESPTVQRGGKTQ